MHMFMQVNSVFAGNDVLQSRARLSARLEDISLANTYTFQLVSLGENWRKICTFFVPFVVGACPTDVD